MERIYDQQEGYTPYLFYAVFGQKARLKQVVETTLFPDMELLLYDHIYHKKEMELLREGALIQLLKTQDEQQYEQVMKADACLVLRGNVKEDQNLQYLVKAMDLLTGFMQEGIEVLDLLSMQWYDTGQWNTLIAKDFYVHDHIQILVSQEQNGIWLHTRGMMKFGRPDISIVQIPKERTHEMKRLMDQIIYYEAYGAMVLQPSKFQTNMGIYTIHPVFYHDFDNYDFNNAFIEMKYPEIIKDV